MLRNKQETTESIVHDLNNIITAILAHASILELSARLTAEQLESVRSIEEGAKKISTIINQLCLIQNDAVTSRNPNIDFNILVKNTISLFSAIIPKNITVSVESQETVFVSGSDSELSRLVLNLLLNARDALPKDVLPNGGAIKLHLTRKTLDSASAEKLGLHQGDFVCLEVADNGIGIKNSIRDNVFKPYFSTKDGQQRGIGLDISLAVAKAHHGTITFESVEGKGSNFFVYLPQAENKAGQSEADNAKKSYSNKDKILIVDDDPTVRLVLQKSLQHMGYDVNVLSSPMAAIKHYEQNVRAYALIIIDMIMPELSGEQLFFKLKEIDSSVPVLISSGYTADNRAKRILESGGLGFIMKPFTVEQLAVEIKKCIAIK